MKPNLDAKLPVECLPGPEFDTMHSLYISIMITQTLHKGLDYRNSQSRHLENNRLIRFLFSTLHLIRDTLAVTALSLTPEQHEPKADDK